MSELKKYDEESLIKLLKMRLSLLNEALYEVKERKLSIDVRLGDGRHCPHVMISITKLETFL